MLSHCVPPVDLKGTTLSWAFKLNSALATAETRDLKGYKVNICIMKPIWKNKNRKETAKHS
jgi:hypothetical protein